MLVDNVCVGGGGKLGLGRGTMVVQLLMVGYDRLVG